MKSLIQVFMIAGFGLAGASRGPAVEIIGHRGAAQDAPENTLTAFKTGYQQKADAVELDIYVSKDGKLVVIHDPTTGRTAGGVDKRVADQTAGELRQLDVGWKGRLSEKIPLLEEVFPLVPEGKRLFVDVKTGPEFLPEFKRILARSGRKPGQIVLIGFDYQTMRQAKAECPDLPVYWLDAPDSRFRLDRRVDDLIPMAQRAKFDGLDLACDFPIDKAFVTKVHQAGLKLYTWTVDEAAVARKEVDAGVDGITTDRPGWLREQLISESAGGQ